MIPAHQQFIEAIHARLKVNVRFYSLADSQVVDRVCALMDYGPADKVDGPNRYLLWDYASTTGSHTLSMLPQQILGLQVLGQVFDPAQLDVPAQWSVPRDWNAPLPP